MGKRRSSRLRSCRLSLAAAEVERLARAMVINHETHIQDGYRLMGSCAVWRRRGGFLTARFVYRRRGDFLATISYVLRDVAG